MRFAIETTGTLRSTEGDLSADEIEAVFDRVAEALGELHDLEADVAVNIETAQAEFYIVVEAPDTRAAFAVAYELQDRAMAAAEVGVEWNAEAHARPTDLVPA